MKKVTVKGIFRIFFIFSIAFLVIHLIKANYIVWPKFRVAGFLMLSFLFLICSLFLNVAAWKAFLKIYQIDASFAQATEAMGLSVFGKYIPGKFWLIAGMSAKIATFTNKSVGTITSVSFVYQAILILIGMIVGLPAMINIINIWIILPLMLLSFFSILIIFSKTTSRVINKLLNKIKFIKIVLEYRSIAETAPTLLLILIQWIMYSFGFYFMIQSISPIHASLLSGFIYPIATIGGILVLFAPGGLGVREGILVALLHGFGFTLQDSLTIAAFSRLWFLFGEVFLFLSGAGLLFLRNVTGERQ